MKRKRLALLLAIAMTVTSLDSTAMVASGADFSSEPVVEEEVSTQAEEESQPVAEEEENIEFSDSDEAEIDFSADEATDESTVQETPDEVEVQEEENSNEEVFSDSNEVSVETTDGTEVFSEESSMQPVIKNISVSLSQGSPVAGFDNFASVLSNCEMTVTYTDGTEELYNANNWAGYTTIDSYGNSISPVWKRNGQIIEINEDNAKNEYFAESVYTLQYVTGSEEDNTLFYSNKVTVNPVSPELMKRYMGELREGENTELNHYGSEDVFKFVPKSSGTWSFIYDDYDYRGMTVKKKNEDGSYTTLKKSSPVCELEEGVTYYFVFYVGDESIKVTKLDGSTSVSANMDNVKKDFIYRLDDVFLSGAELTIKYNDEESETITFGNATKLYDSRGNLYSYRFYNADVSDESQRKEYDPGSAPLETGTFKLYFTQNGQKLDGEYEITISKPKLSSFPQLSEGLNKNISSPEKEYAWYTFTPAKTTKYRFWPVNSVRIYEVNGDRINQIYAEDSSWLDGDYVVFSLKAECTYYVGFSGYVYIKAQHGYKNTMDLQIINAGGCVWETKRTDPTCTEDGKLVEKCKTHQDEAEKVTVLPALGHDLTDWKVTKAATCAKNGEKERHCTRTGCKEKQTQVIKATGKHSMGAWKVTKAATAVAAGVKERTCKVCGGAKERASIAKLKATLTLNVPVNRTLPMKMRQTFQAKVSGLAKGDKVVSWTSSNRRVATVSGNGRIAAQRIAGNAVITVKLASGKTARFTVKVQRTDVATTAITVTNKATRRRLTGTVNLKLRKNLALGVGLTPLTSTQRVTYSTSNSRIASVNSRGVVTARRTGTVTITVRSGRKIARIRVRVTR